MPFCIDWTKKFCFDEHYKFEIEQFVGSIPKSSLAKILVMLALILKSGESFHLNLIYGVSSERDDTYAGS